MIEQFTGNKVRLLIAALMAAFTFALYSPSIGYDFINYDDDVYVYENPHVQKGLSWEGVRYAFTTYDIGTWAAMTWLSLEADTTIMGTKAGAYRTTNIALHSLTGAVLFLALLGLLKRFWPSFLVAAVFLVHPLRTESVVWVTERKDVLFGFFWALGLWAYSYYGQQRSGVRWTLVFLCFIGGMMSKFMMATFPCALLLLDFWPLNRAGHDWATLRLRIWPLVREKIPFFIAIVAFHHFTVAALKGNESFHSSYAQYGNQYLRVLHNYGFYAGKIFWPWPRSIFYPLQPLAWPGSYLVMGSVVVATLVVLRQLWKQPWLAVGWFWFLGTLMPVIGFVPFGHTFVADRYAYVPSIGLTLAVAIGLEHWLKRFAWERRLKFVLAAVILTAYVLATRADLPRWRNSIALYESALRVGDHPVSYNNLTAAYNDQGDFDRTIALCNKGTPLYPTNPELFINRGLAFVGKHDFEQGLTDFKRAIELSPNKPEGYNNRGRIRLGQGDLDGAIEDFTAAIKADPHRASAYNNRGAARMSKRLYEKALADCTKAIELNPEYADAYMNRGNIYARVGEQKSALADIEHAIQLNPDRALYYANRAAIHFDRKEYDLTQADLDKCRQLGGEPHPGLVEALKQTTRLQP